MSICGLKNDWIDGTNWNNNNKNYRICIAIRRIKRGKNSYELQTTQSHKINRNEQNFWKWWIKTDCCTADKHQINWNAKETRRFGWCFCEKCLLCREIALFFLYIFVSDGCFPFEKSFLCKCLKKNDCCSWTCEKIRFFIICAIKERC